MEKNLFSIFLLNIVVNANVSYMWFVHLSAGEAACCKVKTVVYLL